jgi:hypothetical protein
MAASQPPNDDDEVTVARFIQAAVFSPDEAFRIRSPPLTDRAFNKREK